MWPFAGLALLSACLHLQAAAWGNWFDGLEGVIILDPSMNLQQLQGLVDGAAGATSHFGTARRALIFKPGVYPPQLNVNVGYYTSVMGVGQAPEDVVLTNVVVANDVTGTALNNFWRSVEGITVSGPRFTWAVSQGCSLRRSIVKNELWLSHKEGASSGGFMADVNVLGKVTMGTQQQWFTRNSELHAGLTCWGNAWNYVFLGVKGIDENMAKSCGKDVPSFSAVGQSPRVAEKPYLVLEGWEWKIFVPKFSGFPSVGTMSKQARAGSIGLKLKLDEQIFVVKPGMDSNAINAGMDTKVGLLITPGVYHLDAPLVVKKPNFVILGIGYPTLVAPGSKPCIKVLDNLKDVRIAGLILDAHSSLSGVPEPLLQWGVKASGREMLPEQQSVPGVASDLFARIGAFKYLNCLSLRVGTMFEFNADDLVVDNIWAWHADHDDCSGFDLATGSNMDRYRFASDKSKSMHGVVVNGQAVTAYGLSVEHISEGRMTFWKGDYGQCYFYQAELPYRSQSFTAYVVHESSKYHFAVGIGIYADDVMHAHTALEVSPFADIRKVFTVNFHGGISDTVSQVCQRADPSLGWGGVKCYRPEKCVRDICYYPTVQHIDAAARDPDLVPPLLPAMPLLPKAEVDWKDSAAEDRAKPPSGKKDDLDKNGIPKGQEWMYSEAPFGIPAELLGVIVFLILLVLGVLIYQGCKRSAMRNIILGREESAKLIFAAE